MSGKDEYLSLILKYNYHLFNFILTLVPNYSDAEDILQESASIMWDKFAAYQKDTNFLAWARQIVRYQVANYYRKKKAEFRFDDDIIETLTSEHERASECAGERKAALTGCLGKLNPSDLNLIQLRFYKRVTVQDIARRTGQSVHTLYKRISGIYVLLQNCINRTLATWNVD